MFCLHSILLFFFLGVYFVRERESMSRGGAETERERERIPSRLYAVRAEPDTGRKLTNREIMT